MMEVLLRSSSNLQQQDLCEFEERPNLRTKVRTGLVVNSDALQSQDQNVCDFEKIQFRQADPNTLLKNTVKCSVPGGFPDSYASKAGRQYIDNCGIDQQGSPQIKHHTLLRPQSIEPALHQKLPCDFREEELIARMTVKYAGKNRPEIFPGGRRQSEIYGAASIDPAKPNICRDGDMMQPKQQTPSFASKGSGTSSYRHSLLKTSMQSADPGMPVQPVLATPAVLPVVVNAVSASNICRAEDLLRNTSVRPIAKAAGYTDALEGPTVTHSVSMDRPSSVRHLTGGVSVEDLTPDMYFRRDSAEPHNMLSSPTAEWKPVPGLEQPAASRAVAVISTESAGNALPQIRARGSIPTMPRTILRPSNTIIEMDDEIAPSPTQAAYSGAVQSAHKDAEDAVQAVVHKVVQSVAMPIDYSQSEALQAYRKSMVGSLTEAVHKVDKLLRRDSIWEIDAANTAGELFNREPIPEETPDKTNPKLKLQEPGKDKALSFAPEPVPMDCFVPLAPLPKKDAPLSFDRLSEKKYNKDSKNDLHKNPSPTTHTHEGSTLHATAGFKARGNKLVETLASSMNPSHKPSPNVIEASSPKSSKGTGKLKYAFNNVLHGRPASNIMTILPGQAPARSSSLSVQKKFHDNGSHNPRPPLEQLEVAKVQLSEHRSVDMLADRTVERLRYIPSLNHQNCCTSPRSRELVKPLVDAPQDRRASIRDEMRSLSSEDSDPYRTVRWLREMLYSTEPHAPRLTALPPRIRVRPREEPGIPRASTAPCDSVDLLYLGATPEADNKQPEAETSRLVENFNKTIEDLELLLGEALEIARGAAGQDYSQQLPDILTDAASILLRGRENFSTGSVQSHKVMSNAIQSSPQEQASEAPSHIGIRGKLGHRTSSVAGSENSMTQDDSGTSSDDILRDYHQSLQDMTVRSYNRRTEDQSAAFQQTLVATAGAIPTEGGFLPGESPIIASAAENITTAAAFISIPEFESHDNAFMQQRHGITNDFRKASFPLSATTAEKHMSTTATMAPKLPYVEFVPGQIRPQKGDDALPNKSEVDNFIRVFHHPPIQPRMSSLALRKRSNGAAFNRGPVNMGRSSTVETFSRTADPDAWTISTIHSLDGPTSHGSTDEMDFSAQTGARTHGQLNSPIGRGSYEMQDMTEHGIGSVQQKSPVQRLQDKAHQLSLRGRSHVSITKFKGFSLSRSHKRQPIARDWSPIRKRFVATVACISTALIGILIGIYAGEVPSIQYYIADMNHYAVLGNVFFYIGLAIPTIFLWPLPLLHGRKPYVLSAMTIAMPLLFPQALAISIQRSPYVSTYRIGLILPRAIMGFALGFAQMNFMSTLMDLFGASLQSGNPHQEIVDEYDVRRHGGGMGVWLGIWTWCYIGSIGVGFLIGAWIIDTLSPDWGLYVSIILIATVLLLNVITPEVRRSAYRRSVVEIRTKTEVSRRLARGELKMHRTQTGPTWWAQEVHHGIVLTFDMLRQPGFLVLALYLSWIYGQIVLITVLLSSLMSNYYRFASPIVGVTTLAIPIGAVLAIPFQKASMFSRARHHPQRTNSMTFEKRVSWSSHLVRRSIFTLVLPFAGLAYTLSSGGPPTPFILPVLFAGLIGFLSNLAIAECNGIIMEVFDTSDLQPGMTGRPRGSSGEKTKHKRTNYSSFPRVSAAFAMVQGLGFLIAALATGIGGVAQRHLGQQAATSVMAGILLILTLLLLSCLLRWKDVQVIPSVKAAEMEIYERQRVDSIKKMEERRKSGQWDSARVVEEREDEEEQWRPTVIGNPSGKTRRMSILELGHLTRWSEIRRKNRLIDEASYEAHHPNLAALDSVRRKLESKGSVRSGTKSTKKRNKPVKVTAQSFESTESDHELANTQDGDLGNGSKQLMHQEGV